MAGCTECCVPGQREAAGGQMGVMCPFRDKGEGGQYQGQYQGGRQLQGKQGVRWDGIPQHRIALDTCGLPPRVVQIESSDALPNLQDIIEGAPHARVQHAGGG